MFSGNWQVGRGVEPRPNEANNSPDGIFSKVEGNDNKPFEHDFAEPRHCCLRLLAAKPVE
jgi:hypothetical protein